MLKIYAAIAGLLAVTSLFVACSSVGTQPTYSQRPAFPDYDAYVWFDRFQSPIDDPRVDMDVVDERVKRAVNRELFRKGFTLVDEESAEMIIAYRVALKSKISTKTLSQSSGYDTSAGWIEWSDATQAGGAGGMPVQEGRWTYDVGTLIIEVVQASSNRLLWRGSTQAHVRLDQSDSERAEKVDQAVAEILAEFPPR